MRSADLAASTRRPRSARKQWQFRPHRERSPAPYPVPRAVLAAANHWIHSTKKLRTSGAWRNLTYVQMRAARGTDRIGGGHMDSARPRVVVVGAGFGGLEAARKLAKLPVQVTVIDKKNHHTFQPLLYQVATAGISPGEIAAPV